MRDNSLYYEYQNEIHLGHCAEHPDQKFKKIITLIGLTDNRTPLRYRGRLLIGGKVASVSLI